MRASKATMSALISGCCIRVRGGGRSAETLLRNSLGNLAPATCAAGLNHRYMYGTGGRFRVAGFVGWHQRGFASKSKRSRPASFVGREKFQALKGKPQRFPPPAVTDTEGTAATGTTKNRKRGPESKARRPSPTSQQKGPSPGYSDAVEDCVPADAIKEATLRWVQSNVVGLNLCPWAGGALTGGQMRVVVHPSKGDKEVEGEEAVSDAGEYDDMQLLLVAAVTEAAELAALKGPAAENATTLIVVHPSLELGFDDFLRVVEGVDKLIDTQGLRGIVQLATFHPEYCFDGADVDDASNFTNRSPYPVLHLLREDQVAAAVEQIGDPAMIWKKNVETMQELGAEVMHRSVLNCIDPPTNKNNGSSEER